LSQPGDDVAPVYTNEFMIVRAESAQTFTKHANETMRIWNEANQAAKGETKLVFEVEEKKLGERAATLYSLDVLALECGLVPPEVRQTMEKMFGPNGKLRVWIVPIDDTNVLLAIGTEEQVMERLKVLDKIQKIDWSRGDTNATSALLPAEADWRA